MKRWLSGLLAALTLFSLTGCGYLGTGGPLLEWESEVRFEYETASEDSEDWETLEAPDGEGREDQGEEAASEDGDAELPEDLNGAAAGQDAEEIWVREDGTYTTKEDVAQYIHVYGRLPDNFITKKEAEKLGWSGGSLEPYAPGQNLCIGGSRFGNYEGRLPEAEGRSYTECDVGTMGAKSRGAKRIVFSNDGLIYYTEDHYETFELLYGEEGDG